MINFQRTFSRFLNKLWPTPILLVAVFISSLANPASGRELYWYLASSMSRPGQEIVAAFNQRNQPFTVILLTGGSGQLLSKIKSASKGDLFTPASTSFINQVQNLGLLADHSPLIRQTPVFALSKEGAEKIKSWADLTKSGNKIGLGNPKTMALGRSYQQIKMKMGQELTEKLTANKVVEAINANQIINYLKADIIDAGLSFASTARANDLKYIDIPQEFNKPEIAPLIRLTIGNQQNCQAFVSFIKANLATFTKYGFGPVIEEKE